MIDIVPTLYQTQQNWEYVPWNLQWDKDGCSLHSYPLRAKEQRDDFKSKFIKGIQVFREEIHKSIMKYKKAKSSMWKMHKIGQDLKMETEAIKKNNWVNHGAWEEREERETTYASITNRI